MESKEKSFNASERYWFRNGVNRIIDSIMFPGIKGFDEKAAWEKILIYMFVLALPFICSFNGLAF